MSLYTPPRPPVHDAAVERLIHSIVHSEDIIAIPMVGTETDTGSDTGGGGDNGPDLTAIEALTGTGIACRTAADTWALRTMVAPAAGLTITNPGGVAGDPTFAFANDLAGVEGLATTGLAVRTAADTWATRAILNGEGIGMTNGSGVGGDPTIDLRIDLLTAGTTFDTGDLVPIVDVSAGASPGSQRKLTREQLAVGLNGLIDHGLLAGLTDDDHSQYVLRAGRTGDTNDFTISTTQTGVITGSAVGTLGLILRANPTAVKGFIDLFDRTRIMADTSAFPDPLGSPFNIIDIMPVAFTTAVGDAFNLFAVRFAPILTVSANPAGISLFYAAPELDTPNNTNRAMGDAVVVQSNFTYLPVGTGLITNVRHRAVVHNPQFIDGGTAGNVIGRCVGIETSGFLDANWTATDWCVGRLIDPTGTGAITRIGGLMIEDLAAHGSAQRYSVWNKSLNAPLCHAGAALFGATQSTITPPATSAGIELRSTILALLVSRMNSTEEGALTPTDGMLLYNNEIANPRVRRNGNWTSVPFDAYAPGIGTTIQTGHFGVIVDELQLTGTQRLTLEGTARLVVEN